MRTGADDSRSSWHAATIRPRSFNVSARERSASSVYLWRRHGRGGGARGCDPSIQVQSMRRTEVRDTASSAESVERLRRCRAVSTAVPADSSHVEMPDAGVGRFDPGSAYVWIVRGRAFSLRTTPSRKPLRVLFDRRLRMNPVDRALHLSYLLSAPVAVGGVHRHAALAGKTLRCHCASSFGSPKRSIALTDGTIHLFLCERCHCLLAYSRLWGQVDLGAGSRSRRS